MEIRYLLPSEEDEIVLPGDDLHTPSVLAKTDTTRLPTDHRSTLESNRCLVACTESQELGERDGLSTRVGGFDNYGIIIRLLEETAALVR